MSFQLRSFGITKERINRIFQGRKAYGRTTVVKRHTFIEEINGGSGSLRWLWKWIYCYAGFVNGRNQKRQMR
jgi:hypothetical protein